MSARPWCVVTVKDRDTGRLVASRHFAATEPLCRVDEYLGRVHERDDRITEVTMLKEGRRVGHER